MSTESEWAGQKRKLLEQITKVEEEHLRLKRENDEMEKSMDLHLWHGASAAATPDDAEDDINIGQVQGEIAELLREKQELELRAKRAQEAMQRARRTERAVTQNHQQLLKGFQQLKVALDVDDERARDHLQKLLGQLKTQQRALEEMHAKEEREYTIRAAQLASEVVPGVSAHIQQAIAEEKAKTVEALRTVEAEARAKFEAAARVASDRYAAECEKVLARLGEEKRKQDEAAETLEQQVRDAERELTELYAQRRDAFRAHEDAVQAEPPDPESVEKLRRLRVRCRQLWADLHVEPERIIAFLDTVRRVSPPDEAFYRLLCRTAEQLTAKLAVQEALKQRDELLEILADIKGKCVAAVQAAEKVARGQAAAAGRAKTGEVPALAAGGVPPADGGLEEDEGALAAGQEAGGRLDLYVAKNLVKQLRVQYNCVAGDVESVTARLQRLLSDYRRDFGEDYVHQGTALSATSVGTLEIASLNQFLPTGW
jgi:hypothetical protein